MAMQIRDLFDPGSRIRDGYNSVPGSGINIPGSATLLTYKTNVTHQT